MSEHPLPRSKVGPQIALITDFGSDGPYLGQMQSVICDRCPGASVINLLSNAPAHDPRAGAYLVASYHPRFPEGTVFVCVVDPTVGTSQFDPSIVHAAGHWFVGPHNGLFDVVLRAEPEARLWIIEKEPEHISSSFHGRDLYAPIAAEIADGKWPEARETKFVDERRYPDVLAEVVYIDSFGNAMLGIPAETLTETTTIQVGARTLAKAATFASLPIGVAFWYENANGLAELAVNHGRADEVLGLKIGTSVKVGSGHL